MDQTPPKSGPRVPETTECDGDGGCSNPTGSCKTQRRTLLAALSGAAAASTAGCVGLFGEPDHLSEPEDEEVADPDDGEAEEDEPDEDEEAGEDADGFQIEFLNEDETIPVAEDEELLYAGLDQGWDLPYQCEVGVCGQCTAKVDGDGQELVEMTENQYLDDDEIEEGYILTCTGQPRDEFSIETDEHP